MMNVMSPLYLFLLLFFNYARECKTKNVLLMVGEL